MKLIEMYQLDSNRANKLLESLAKLSIRQKVDTNIYVYTTPVLTLDSLEEETKIQKEEIEDCLYRELKELGVEIISIHHKHLEPYGQDMFFVCIFKMYLVEEAKEREEYFNYINKELKELKEEFPSHFLSK